MRSSRLVGLLAGAIAVLQLFGSSAAAAAPHTVLPGESLWSIAAANNFTTRTVAAYNGLSEDAQVYVGETIEIPTEAEGAAALAAAGTGTTSTGSSATHTVTRGESLSTIAYANGLDTATLASFNGLDPEAWLVIGQTIEIPASGSSAVSSDGTPLGSIPSPYGTLYLRSDAAAAWNALREEALAVYGVDLHPEGPLSAYRTYEQQADLYQQYIDGIGALAAPPGTSEHNFGIALDVATPEMRSIVDAIGGAYGWGKYTTPDEWWHITYGG